MFVPSLTNVALDYRLCVDARVGVLLRKVDEAFHQVGGELRHHEKNLHFPLDQCAHPTVT